MTQRCPRCEQYLPQDAYHPDKWGKRGHYCRDCARSYKLRWRRERGIQPRQAKPPKPKAPRILSVGYRAVHKRIQRLKGKASNQPCAHQCGSPAAEWAYDHLDPSPVIGTTDRGLTVEYSQDPSRYIALCKRCHSKFDAAQEVEA